MFVCDSSSVITKKGKTAGTTLLAHSKSPDFDASKLDLENITKQIAITTKMNGNIFFLKDRNTNFINSSLLFLIYKYKNKNMIKMNNYSKVRKNKGKKK